MEFRRRNGYEGVVCRTRLWSCAVGFVLSFSILVAPAFGDQWTVLEDCRFDFGKYFDADSFHSFHSDEDRIFRLYFVDAPEQDYRFGRLEKQAEYFNADVENVLAVAHEASAFVKTILTNSLTIRTKWRKAGGQSSIPRHYAVVEVDGRDLAEILVERGYARVFGTKTDYPDGTSAKRIESHLRALEDKARTERLGVWRYSVADADESGLNEM